MSFLNRPRSWVGVLMFVGMLTVVKPAAAILGIGDIVYDPTNFEEALQQLAELERHYAQLVQANAMLNNQYQQMLRMAQPVPVNMTARYRSLAAPWTSFSATNTVGTTGSWTESINNGLNIPDGYSAATIALGAYGAAMGNIPSEQQANVKAGYATVELTDGANRTGMQTIGTLRNNAAATAVAIQNLEDDSLSSDPSMNTEIAVLNKINAANLINVRNTHDANQVLVSLAEQQIIRAKAERDAEAEAFNDHIRFTSEAKAVMAAQAQGASAAMMAWRMP